MSGVKYDAGKTDMGLLFIEVPRALEEASKALQLGSEKYGVGNWMRVENGNPRYLSALVRHLTAYYQGEKHDKESGLSHLAHVATNALFLLDLERQHDYISLQGRSIGGGQQNDGWVTAEVGQIPKDLYPKQFFDYGPESSSLRPSGECLKPVSSEGSAGRGAGCAFNPRYEG